MLIVAVSIVPIAGMMGGAVDLSRAYLVQARMQQACDAGALAGRKSMSGTVLTTADKAEAYRYFSYNFPSGTMGSKPIVQGSSTGNYVIAEKTTDDQIKVRAGTTVPTTLLRVLGKQDIRVAVTCVGEEYYVNTDIMLVLDTTGSMNCKISESSSCSNITEKTNSKMWEMRTALKKLYDDLKPAQTALTAKNLRMRFGFVQYASTVNVGKLIRAVDTTYIRNPYNLYYNCTTRSNGNCTAASQKASVTRTAAWLDTVWEGCIEERSTSSAFSSTSTTIPSDAYDLDLVTKPTSDATRWAPYDETLTGDQSYGPNWYNAACPKAAAHLKTWTETEFDSKVDTIVQGDGSTYHDIGMNWGTRMIAPVGIFATLNPSTFNNVKVARTIVLMTDGAMAPDDDSYSAYGTQKWAKREYTGSDSNELTKRHTKRFNLMCSRAKELGISVWVIAVSVGLTDSLTQCADSGQALTVTNSSELSDAFKQIADKVGNLRLGA